VQELGITLDVFFLLLCYISHREAFENITTEINITEKILCCIAAGVPHPAFLTAGVPVRMTGKRKQERKTGY